MNIRVCRGSQERKRIVTEDKVYDCHNYCEKYKEAVRQARKLEIKRYKGEMGERELRAYLTADKEKRRRNG